MVSLVHPTLNYRIMGDLQVHQGILDERPNALRSGFSSFWYGRDHSRLVAEVQLER
jgi:hypothetical protein